MREGLLHTSVLAENVLHAAELLQADELGEGTERGEVRGRSAYYSL